MLTISQIGYALKDWYLPAMREQINQETDALWAELEKTTEMVQGGDIVLALRYGRSGGIGSRDDDGDLPSPNARKGLQARFKTKNTFAHLQLTTKTIEISKTDRGAFASQLELQLNDLMTDAKDNSQRQLYGDGTGRLTGFSNGATSDTQEVTSTDGLFEGQFVDLMATNGTVKSAKLEIIAVDDENGTVKFDQSVTTLTTDFLVLNGSYNKELTGIKAIFTPDTSIYGVPRTTYPFFNPTIVNIAGEISENKIQEGLDKARNRTGVRHDFLITSDGVRRAWANLQRGYRQTVNTVELKGGWSAPAYQNGAGQLIPMITAKYAPKSTMRAISRANFMLAWLGDWAWMDQDGAVLSRISGKPAYGATMQLFADLCCDVPRGQVEFQNITEH